MYICFPILRFIESPLAKSRLVYTNLKLNCQLFFLKKVSHLPKHFNNTWLARVAYLADTLNWLNNLNLALRGGRQYHFEQTDTTLSNPLCK